MWEYSEIVIKAINKEVVPLVLNAIGAACGPNWFDTYGKQTLSLSKDWKKRNIPAGISPLDFIDSTAAFFLLFPYEEDEHGKTRSLPENQGIMGRMIEFYHLEGWQIGKLRRFRIIRNAVVHKKTQNLGELSAEDKTPGGLERRLLTELEASGKILNPGFHLAAYFAELNQELAKAPTPAQPQMQKTRFQTIAEETRRAVRNREYTEFMDAPIGPWLEGPAPWSLGNIDLEHLPWPDVEKETTVQKKASSNEGLAGLLNKFFGL